VLKIVFYLYEFYLRFIIPESMDFSDKTFAFLESVFKKEKNASFFILKRKGKKKNEF